MNFGVLPIAQGLADVDGAPRVGIETARCNRSDEKREFSERRILITDYGIRAE